MQAAFPSDKNTFEYRLWTDKKYLDDPSYAYNYTSLTPPDSPDHVSWVVEEWCEKKGWEDEDTDDPFEDFNSLTVFVEAPNGLFYKVDIDVEVTREYYTGARVYIKENK